MQAAAIKTQKKKRRRRRNCELVNSGCCDKETSVVQIWAVFSHLKKNQKKKRRALKVFLSGQYVYALL